MTKIAALLLVAAFGALIALLVVLGSYDPKPVETQTITRPQVTTKLNEQRKHPNGFRRFKVQTDEGQWYVEATDQRLSRADLARVCPKHAKPSETELIGTKQLGKRALVTCPGGKD